MGGLGSGRHWHWGTKATTTEYRRLDVRRLARLDLLREGQSYGWQWSNNGEVTAEIKLAVGASHIQLRYKTRDMGGDWERMDYPVPILSQPCHFGGNRYWFACPARGCGRRVAILYGGKVFACRTCHQLAYPSTREQGWQREQRRANKIAARLGWAEDVDLLYGTKPKGMHWKTFERLKAEYDYWEDSSNTSFAVGFLSKWGRLV